MTRGAPMALACWIALNTGLPAQDVRRLVENSPDGLVRISFAARPDLCGDYGWRSGRRSDEHWESSDACMMPVVRVQLRKGDGKVAAARVYMGGRWRTGGDGVTDLGMVSAQGASSYLLGIARTDPVGHRVIRAAALADSSVVWPDLVDMARDETLGRHISEEALQWLGIIAGAFFEDDEFRDDRSDARQRALFSMAQLSKEQGIPRLIDVSESHRFEYMRALALFWLGQSGDQRAVAVMERVFRARGNN